MKGNVIIHVAPASTHHNDDPEYVHEGVPVSCQVVESSRSPLLQKQLVLLRLQFILFLDVCQQASASHEISVRDFGGCLKV